jgi:biotin carboxylase
MSVNKKSTILITSSHSRIGLNVARSLTSKGFRVVAGGREKHSMCRGLKGVISEFCYDDPFHNHQSLLSEICAAAERNGASYILPVHEEIFVVSMMRSELEKHGLTVIAPDFETLLDLHDKANIPFFARKAGVDFPDTVVLEQEGSLEGAVARLGFPFIVKSRWGSGAINVYKIRNHHDLLKLKQDPKIEVSGSYIAQTEVPGRGAGVGILICNSKTLAVGGHLRIREVPISGGTSTARATLNHEGLLEAGRAVVEATGLAHGVCMAEFRYDAPSGKFWIIELNPRYWGGLSASMISGVDFPALHVLATIDDLHLEHPVRASTYYETRWLLGEVRALLEYARALQWRQVAAMFRRLPKHKLFFEDFGWGRFIIFMNQLYGYFSSYKKYGNFGYQSQSKSNYFDNVMTDYLSNVKEKHR